MAQTTRSAKALTYPEPTLVVGLGRVGLAVLERLGEDWSGLRALNPDPALRNLRLLHVSARTDGPTRDRDALCDFGLAWQRNELHVRALVRNMGEGDLPDRALDLAILRACGLLRFCDGQYQVAEPYQAGVAEVPHVDIAAVFGEPATEPGESAAGGEHLIARPVRCRSVRWLTLAADPMIALDVLGELRRTQVALDQMLGRVVFRIRAGHSPVLLLSVLGRAMAWLSGRDPSPWSWIRDASRDVHPHWPQATAGCEGTVEISCPPSPGSSYFPSAPQKDWILRIPAPFVPTDGDMMTPWPKSHDVMLAHDQFDFFGLDRNKVGADTHVVRVLPMAEWEHGFYDNDSTNWYETASTPGSGEAGGVPFAPIQHFEIRLKQLGRLTEQGMVRLWDSLHKGQSQKSTDDDFATRRAEGIDKSVTQCIEILGDTVIRSALMREMHNGAPWLVLDLPGEGPFNHDQMVDLAVAGKLHAASMVQKNGHEGWLAITNVPALSTMLQAGPRSDMCLPPGRPDLREPWHLPRHASSELRKRAWEDPADPVAGQLGALLDRLAALGHGFAHEAPPHFPLLREVELEPWDVAGDLVADAHDRLPESELETAGQKRLRTTVAKLAGELFNLDELRAWRELPSRRAPRLVVFVVADLSEPFARSALPTTLRMLHYSLSQTLGPVFVAHRSGLDRALHIQPLLTFPNPANPGANLPRNEARAQEALILEALHIVRRKLEVAPPEATNVAHVMLVSRVTDNAVSHLDRTVETIRDYVTLMARNELVTEQNGTEGREGQLAELFLGRQRRDLFATFSITMAEVPESHLRWYFANRMARRLMSELADDGQTSGSPPLAIGRTAEEEGKPRQPLIDCARKATGQIAALCDVAGTEIAKTFGYDFDVATDGESFARGWIDGKEAYAGPNCVAEDKKVFEQWRRLTDERSPVERFFSELRVGSNKIAQAQVATAQHDVDEEIREAAAKMRGVGSILAALERQVDDKDRRVATVVDDMRRLRESCRNHGIPDTGKLAGTRQDVVEMARLKPDAEALRSVSLLWLPVVAVIGTPLFQALAQAIDLPKRPNGLEWLIGVHAAWPSALVLGSLLIWLLHRHLKKRTDKVREAIAAHQDQARHLFVSERVGNEAEFQKSTEFGRGTAQGFLQSRLSLVEEIAWYFYSSTTRAAAARDRKDAGRLQRSVKASQKALQSASERNGIRELRAGTVRSLAEEDTSRYLSGKHHKVRNWLLAGRDIGQVYARWIDANPVKEKDNVERIVESFITTGWAAVESPARSGWGNNSNRAGPLFGKHDGWADRIARTGDVSRWRSEAWLADVDAIVEVFARHFDGCGIADSEDMQNRIDANLERFLMGFYANVGFAAQFRGFEGLDRDNLTVAADTKVLLTSGLLSPAARKQLESPGDRQFSAGRRPRFDVLDLPLSMKSAWLMSLARDIQVDTLQNLRRFQHHFERSRPADNMVFPYTPQGYRPDPVSLATHTPVTLTMTHRAFVDAVRMALSDEARALPTGTVMARTTAASAPQPTVAPAEATVPPPTAQPPAPTEPDFAAEPEFAAAGGSVTSSVAKNIRKSRSSRNAPPSPELPGSGEPEAST